MKLRRGWELFAKQYDPFGGWRWVPLDVNRMPRHPGRSEWWLFKLYRSPHALTLVYSPRRRRFADNRTRRRFQFNRDPEILADAMFVIEAVMDGWGL